MFDTVPSWGVTWTPCRGWSAAVDHAIAAGCLCPVQTTLNPLTIQPNIPIQVYQAGPMKPILPNKHTFALRLYFSCSASCSSLVLLFPALVRLLSCQPIQLFSLRSTQWNSELFHKSIFLFVKMCLVTVWLTVGSWAVTNGWKHHLLAVVWQNTPLCTLCTLYGCGLTHYCAHCVHSVAVMWHTTVHIVQCTV